MKHINQRGDTIVEVILAMAMLAFVLFSSWAITNRASQLSLAARQRVVMVNQLREQAELLKSYKLSDVVVFNAIEKVGISALSDNPCKDIDMYKSDAEQVTGKLDKAFNLVIKTEVDGTKSLHTESGSKSVGDDSSQRIWIQKEVKDPRSGYSDFYVRGCWVTTGGTQKLDNSQFIVRINT